MKVHIATNLNFFFFEVDMLIRSTESYENVEIEKPPMTQPITANENDTHLFRSQVART